jgi:hypothetical protein
MPPRYAYWTIIVDNQPTAFRSSSQEELMPTFKRLKAKNDTAVMMWFQLGKLWPSRVDAQEFMHARGEMARKGDDRQLSSRSSSGGGFRDRERKPFRERTERSPRTAWTPRGEPSSPAPARNADDKLDWKAKGEFVPAPKRADRPDWTSKPQASSPRPSRSEKPAWKPKGSFDRESKADWKSKSSFDGREKREWKPKTEDPRPRSSEKPEWKPKGSFTPAPRRSEKPDWKPKASFDREERPRSFKRPDFKPSGDNTRSPKPEWKPKGSFDRERTSDWKPKSHKSEGAGRGPGRSAEREGRPEWKPKGSFEPQARRPRTTERPDWTPRSGHTEAQPSEKKRKWVPKEEYKKSMGIEARRDSKWRPGGEHKDPKQKYKDAKKAKWTKFKKDIRARSGGKGKKSS